MCFTTAKGFIAGQAGKSYPAPLEVVKAMEKAASKDRAGALKAEAHAALHALHLRHLGGGVHLDAALLVDARELRRDLLVLNGHEAVGELDELCERLIDAHGFPRTWPVAVIEQASRPGLRNSAGGASGTRRA